MMFEAVPEQEKEVDPTGDFKPDYDETLLESDTAKKVEEIFKDWLPVTKPYRWQRACGIELANSK